MKRALLLFCGLLFFASCEKERVFELKRHFEGSINGFKVSSLVSDSKYRPVPGFGVYLGGCTMQGYGSLTFSFFLKGKSLPILTTFFTENIQTINGDSYNSFITAENGKDLDCKGYPAVLQSIGLEGGDYSLVPTQDQNLKITNVTTEHVEGSFKVKFISRSFLKTGLSSPDQQGAPDSLVIICDKFMAPIIEHF